MITKIFNMWIDTTSKISFMPLRMLANFAVVACLGGAVFFLVALIPFLLVPSFSASYYFHAALGCGIGTGVVNCILLETYH